MDLQGLVEQFVQIHNSLKQSGSSPELKAQGKALKNQLAQEMETRHHTYFRCGELYVVLTTKLKQPSLDAGFIARAFFEFQKNPTLMKGSPEEVAVRFGEGVFFARKKQAVTYKDIKVTKKPPVAARLQEDFQM